MQPNEKKLLVGSNAVDTQWERDKDAKAPQRTPTGLCASAIDIAISCVLWARQRNTRGAVGDFTTLSRLPHSVYTACLSERRAMVRTLCMFKMRASAWSSIMFKAIPPRQMPLRCYGAVSCVHLGVLRCLRTQRDRPEDAAQLWQGFTFCRNLYFYSLSC